MKSIIVHFEAHPVFDLVVLQRYVVLEDYVCLLQTYFVGARANLRRDQLLQLQHRVTRATLYPLPFPHTIIDHNLYQHRCVGVVDQFAFSHQI